MWHLAGAAQRPPTLREARVNEVETFEAQESNSATLVLLDSASCRVSLLSPTPLTLEQAELLRYLLKAALLAGGKTRLLRDRYAQLFPHLTFSSALLTLFSTLRLRLEFDKESNCKQLVGPLFAFVAELGEWNTLHVELSKFGSETLARLSRGLPLAFALPRPHLADAGAQPYSDAEDLAAWRDTLDLFPAADEVLGARLELYGHLVRAFYGDAAGLELGSSPEPHSVTLPSRLVRKLAENKKAASETMLALVGGFVRNFPSRVRLNGQEPERVVERLLVSSALTVEVTVVPFAFDGYERYARNEGA